MLTLTHLSTQAIAHDTHYAKITTKFHVQPKSVHFTGNSLTNSQPIFGSFLFQPQPGLTLQSFPVQEGASQALVPAQKIYFAPFFPLPNSPLIPQTYIPLGGPNLETTLPAMTLNLPSPVPEGSTTMLVPVSPAITANLSIPYLSGIPAVHTVLGPALVNNVPGGPIDMPLVPVSALTLDINGHDTEYHYGTLNYTLNFKSLSNHPRAWSWSIAGTWNVKISDYSSQPDTAVFTHHRHFNNVGDVLQSATEPSIMEIGTLSVTSTSTSNVPNYKIQFKKTGSAEKHTLTFINNMGIGPPTSSQTFPNVAFLALGQWLRKMGDPSLKVSAPITGTNSINWSIPVGLDSKMDLEWRMY